jgi:stage II sporulation protein D
MTMVGLLLTIALALLDSAAAAKTPKETEPVLRVKIGSLFKKIEISFKGGGMVANDRGRRLKTIRDKGSFVWQLPSHKSRKKIEYLNQTLAFTGKSDQISFNGKQYRGKMLIKFGKTGALVVNHVGIEDYLRGVVGSEMGSLSPAESLKAQTVIARTYAYSNRGKHGRDGADVCDSTHCQVYKGVSAERESINKAVNATRGIIMVSDGKPIQTLYHATCGGMTSDNDKVFGGAPCSYLRRVICPFCKDGSHYRWVKSLSIGELKSGMAKEKIHFNHLYDFGYESPALLDRVDKVFLSTDKGEFSVKGTTFRRLFDLKSTTFTLGNRKAVRKIIDMAVEKQPSRMLIAIRGLGETASDGPPQLILQTGRGLKRVTRPEQGWQIISCRQTETASQSMPLVSRNEPLKSNVSGRIDKIEIFGRGYGHQVGLCQSGAIEMGKRNWSYRQILPFYYANVALRKLGY